MSEYGEVKETGAVEERVRKLEGRIAELERALAAVLEHVDVMRGVIREGLVSLEDDRK